MTRGTMRRTTPLLALLLLVATGAWAQSFRAIVDNVVPLTSETAESRSLAPSAALVIVPEGDSLFVEGLALTIEPNRERPGSFAFSVTVYDSVDVTPTGEPVTLAGRPRAEVIVADNTPRFLAVPFGDVPPETRADVIWTEAADPTRGAVAIHIVALGKGIEGAAEAAATVSVAPRLRPVGAVVVELGGEPAALGPARAAFSGRIDGRPITLGEPLLLPPGLYRVDADAGAFLSTRTNVGVEIGDITTVVVEARLPRATVRVALPSVAELFVDGVRRRTGQPLELLPGSHTVSIRVGEYIINRTLDLVANEEYELGLSLDILFKQD